MTASGRLSGRDDPKDRIRDDARRQDGGVPTTEPAKKK